MILGVSSVRYTQYVISINELEEKFYGVSGSIRSKPKEISQ